MKVISVTPAGRKRYLEILVPYLLENRAYIQEHHFWLNTHKKEDIDYIEALAKEYPDFFKINRKEIFDNTAAWICIWQYFKDYVDEDTLYLRFDDDICYIEKDAIKNLISCRIKNPKAFLVYGNVVNNTFCTYLHQEKGAIHFNWHKVKYGYDLEAGTSGKIAEKIHLKFITDIKNNKVENWKFKKYKIDISSANPQVNVISWFGKDLKDLPELETKDLRGVYTKIDGKDVEMLYEEKMLNNILPKRFKRNNIICGDAIFGHYAYTHQRSYLENLTNTLEEYAAIDKNSAIGIKLRSKNKRIKRSFDKKIKFPIKKQVYLIKDHNWSKYPSHFFLFVKGNFPKTYEKLGKIKKKIKGDKVK